MSPIGTSNALAAAVVLVVDPDAQRRDVLVLGLSQAGCRAEGCRAGDEALARVAQGGVDVVVAAMELPGLSGLEVLERIRRDRATRGLPVFVVSDDAGATPRARAFELGATDYLVRPVYVRELLARFELELGRRTRHGALEAAPAGAHVDGELADMVLADLFQTLEVGARSGVLTLRSGGGTEARIWFDGGRVVHAAMAHRSGAAVVYRALAFRSGTFELDLRPIEPPARTVDGSTRAVLVEGLRRLEEWRSLTARLPPLESALEIAPEAVEGRPLALSEYVRAILRVFDGRRSIEEALDAWGGDDLEVLNTVARLCAEGLLRAAGPGRRTLRPAAEARTGGGLRGASPADESSPTAAATGDSVPRRDTLRSGPVGERVPSGQRSQSRG